MLDFLKVTEILLQIQTEIWHTKSGLCQRNDLEAVDVFVAGATARSVGHGTRVAAEDASHGAGVRGLLLVKARELLKMQTTQGVRRCILCL